VQPPTRSATSPRTTPVTCWYRAAIALDDQPMLPITARSGTPRIRSTVAPCGGRRGGVRAPATPVRRSGAGAVTAHPAGARLRGCRSARLG